MSKKHDKKFQRKNERKTGKRLGEKSFQSLVAEEKVLNQAKLLNDLNDLYNKSEYLRNAEPIIIQNLDALDNGYMKGDGFSSNRFDDNEAWIQTYSGQRFQPLKPNPNAIVIQDIAHALSMQCRFNGHTSVFYSVAQHSVLVSYLCDEQDRLYGLLHDASEYVLGDLASPLKRSGHFDSYKEIEKRVQLAVCKRFGLSEVEPASVKRADLQMLATEARDLMSPLHPDWQMNIDPIPMKIEPWTQQQSKDMFMKRFFELMKTPMHYSNYIADEHNKKPQ